MKPGLLIFSFLFSSTSFSQPQHFKICLVAFYNLENLYDTINNPAVNDDDFTPQGIKQYSGKIYLDKLTKLATVISRIGTDISPTTGPALLGVAEIENDTVLSDLLHHPFLRSRDYRMIHYDSKDARGIDVALLYHPRYFVPIQASKLYVSLPGNSKEAYHTRDVLYVKGELAGEAIHVYVNHWPSRRGGETRSSPARKAAARVCRQHIDSLQANEPSAKIIVMGDLNDDPDSPQHHHYPPGQGAKKQYSGRAICIIPGMNCIKTVSVRWPTGMPGDFSTRSSYPHPGWIPLNPAYIIIAAIFLIRVLCSKPVAGSRVTLCVPGMAIPTGEGTATIFRPISY